VYKIIQCFHYFAQTAKHALVLTMLEPVDMCGAFDGVDEPSLESLSVAHLVRECAASALRMVALCERARAILVAEPRVIRLPAPAVVVGDIHGDKIDLDALAAHVWPDGVAKLPGGGVVFLGDYVDRGSDSVAVVCTLFAMKVTSPAAVVLLRGNHEDRTVNCRAAGSGMGFKEECRKRFGWQGDMVWAACNDAFDCLPIAAIISDSVFCAHGGVPVTPVNHRIVCNSDLFATKQQDKATLNSAAGRCTVKAADHAVEHNTHALSEDNCASDDDDPIRLVMQVPAPFLVPQGWSYPKIACQLTPSMRAALYTMWADAVDVACYQPRGGDAGNMPLFDVNNLRLFLQRYDMVAVIRGHQPVSSGCLVSHAGSLVTILSTRRNHNFAMAQCGYACVDGCNNITCHTLPS
jgi:hypothetical protein